MAIQRNKTGEVELSEFAQDVLAGLSRTPKQLPSKYFYDDVGSALFQQIMQLPEYYLTRAELSIFRDKSADLANILKPDSSKPLEIIELGAGDGSKTLHLLNYLEKSGVNLIYRPVDISQKAIDSLKENLKKNGVEITIKPILADYANFNLEASNSTRWFFFLGSNLGNYVFYAARNLLAGITQIMRAGDKLLLGLDKSKSAELILPAYNDSTGITAQFNLNLLARINHEMNANFALSKFRHIALFNEEKNRAESYLQSTENQMVSLCSVKHEIYFEKQELIQTEISQKYNQDIVKTLVSNLPILTLGKVEDDAGYFMDIGFEKLI
ncbi:MAG: L-histidine N(alpha)-methyltransferase [Bacteroidetes bacterium]|nr:L-histidine N(alpha)-methyltransferase [Bacteroidota bacterium]